MLGTGRDKEKMVDLTSFLQCCCYCAIVNRERLPGIFIYYDSIGHYEKTRQTGTFQFNKYFLYKSKNHYTLYLSVFITFRLIYLFIHDMTRKIIVLVLSCNKINKYIKLFQRISEFITFYCFIYINFSLFSFIFLILAFVSDITLFISL